MKQYGILIIFLLLTGQLFSDQSELEKEIQKSLVPPCCGTGTIYDHESSIVDVMKSKISEMVAQGKSKDEILAWFVSQYGEKVLATPPKRGFGLLAYFIPLVVLVGSLGYFIIRKKPSAVADRNTIPSDPAPTTSPPSSIRERIERDVQELN